MNLAESAVELVRGPLLQYKQNKTKQEFAFGISHKWIDHQWPRLKL
jgi:hypothetical protein